MTSRTTCWFCKRNLSDNQSNVKQKMGLITDVESGAHEERITYIPKIITIPRCADCEKAHDDHKIFFTTRKAIFFGILFFIFSLGLMFPPVEVPFVLVAIFGAVLGIFVDERFKEKEMEQKGIMLEIDKWNHPEIKRLKLQGWEEMHN